MSSSSSLPELFGKPTQLLGWQGLTVTIPESWNLVAFSGDHLKGNLRLADDDKLRMEVLWEQFKGTPDVARSVDLLLKNIEKTAKKGKHTITLEESPKLIPRSRKEHADKEQLTNFGWTGDATQTVSHGYGSAWFCETSNRVVVAHIVGSENENPEKTRRLAAEVLSSFQSHGTGGWQTWSAFGLQIEIPDEFRLVSSKMQTGRLEFDWERAATATSALSALSPAEWTRRPERLGLRRLSAANVVLEYESLEDWAKRVAVGIWKKFSFKDFEETEIVGWPGVEAQGRLKDFRRHAWGLVMDKVLRRKTPPPELLAWHDEADNKIFVVLCDLWPVNAGIEDDILDSLQSRT